MNGKILTTLIAAFVVLHAAHAEELRLHGTSPMLLVARSAGRDVIEVCSSAQIVYQTKGERQDPRVPLQVTVQECTWQQSLSLMEIHTVSGEPVDHAEAVRRLEKPTGVILVPAGDLSPFLADTFKPDTLVLQYKRLPSVPSSAAVPPGVPTPAPSGVPSITPLSVPTPTPASAAPPVPANKSE